MSEKTLGYEAAAVDLLDESETSVSGQQVLPSLRKELGRAATTDKIPPRVEVFCWNYADPTRRATFANGTASYLAANPEVKPDSARARAAKLLATDRVRARINEICATIGAAKHQSRVEVAKILGMTKERLVLGGEINQHPHAVLARYLLHLQ